MAGEVTGPNAGIVYGWDQGDSTWKALNDQSLQLIDAVLQLAVLDLAQDTPPSANEGDRFTVGSAPAGDFAGFAEFDVAVFAETAWRAYTPQVGWRLWDVDSAAFYYFTGAAWAAEPVGIADISGFSTSDLSEGTNLYYTEPRVTANTSVAANTTHAGLSTNPHTVTEAQAAAAGRIPSEAFTGAGPHGPVAATDMVFVATGSGAVVLNIPAAGAAGRRYYVKKTSTDTDTVTITPSSGLVENAATLVIGAAGRDQVVLIDDGTGWWIAAA